MATFHKMANVSQPWAALLQAIALGSHHQRFKQSSESPSESMEETLFTHMLASLPLPYGTPSPCSRPGMARLRQSAWHVTGWWARRGSSFRSAPQYRDKTESSWLPRKRLRNSSG
jgi:hypothetical protein